MIASLSSAQTVRLNQLKDALNKTKDPEKSGDLILSICQQNYSLAPDTLLHYLELGKQVIRANACKRIQLEVFEIVYFSKINNVEMAIQKAKTLHQLALEINCSPSTLQKIDIENCRALIRNYQNKEGIEQAFKILQVAEQNKDTATVVQAFVLLSWANMELEKYAESIKWLEKGIAFTSNKKYFILHPASYVNLASCYNNLGEYDKALVAVEKGIELAKEGENLAIHANALNVKADICLKLNDTKLAQSNLEQALLVRERIGDIYYVLSDMGQLSYFYASNGQTQKGIDLAKKGIQMAEQSKQLPKLIYLYSALAENYKRSERSSELAATLTTMLALKDSLYQNNSVKAIAELEGKYEYQKKENTILQQHYELNQSRYIAIGLTILLVLAILLFFSVYKNYQYIQKRKMDNMLKEQRRISEAAILSAEEKERKRIAADLHDNLGAHAAAISSGVKYFKEGLYNQSDILLQLDSNAKDIVNHLNDTIWVLKNEKLHFTNLADRFKLWLQKLLLNYPEIRYHIYEEINNNIELTPHKILHLFLILKESVNNAIRHSRCNEISIHFESDLEWHIAIEDNGIGFDRSTDKQGNGITNMIQRAKECDCQIVWKTLASGGTRIDISGTTIN